jgi:hypothetical protein
MNAKGTCTFLFKETFRSGKGNVAGRVKTGAVFVTVICKLKELVKDES